MLKKLDWAFTVPMVIVVSLIAWAWLSFLSVAFFA